MTCDDIRGKTSAIEDELVAMKDKKVVLQNEIRKISAKYVTVTERFREEVKRLNTYINQQQTELSMAGERYLTAVATLQDELLMAREQHSADVERFDAEMRSRDERYFADVERLRVEMKNLEEQHSAEINSLMQNLKEKDTFINSLLNSISWKITTPLRMLYKPFVERRGK